MRFLGAALVFFAGVFAGPLLNNKIFTAETVTALMKPPASVLLVILVVLALFAGIILMAIDRPGGPLSPRS